MVDENDNINGKDKLNRKDSGTANQVMDISTVVRDGVLEVSNDELFNLARF
jgi:hypothetical protein